MHKITRLFLFVFIILSAVFIAGLLFFTKKTPPPQTKETVAMNVKIFHVSLQSLRPQIQLMGRLQPSAQTDLRFEVSAQLIKKNVTAGQTVKKGAILLELDAQHYQQALNKMEALYTQEVLQNQQEKALLDISHEALELQQQETERIIRLNKKGLISISKLEQAKRTLLQKKTETTRLEYSVKKATARENALMADLKRAQLNLENTRLRAPFNGTVNTVNVDIGDYVNQAQGVLTLIKTDFLELPLQIDTNTVAQLSLRQKIDIFIKKKTIIGEITAIQRSPNSKTFTHRLIIRIPGQNLMPGLQATANLTLHTLHNKRVIPEKAILYEDDNTYIFLVEGNTLHKTSIKIGQRVGSKRIVLDGLKKGALIVSENVAAMSDDLIIQPNPLP